MRRARRRQGAKALRRVALPPQAPAPGGGGGRRGGACLGANRSLPGAKHLFSARASPACQKRGGVPCLVRCLDSGCLVVSVGPGRLEEPVIPRAASRRDSSVRNSPRGGAAAPAAAAQPTSPSAGQCVQPTSPGSSARSSCVGGCHVAPGSMRSSRPDLPESSGHSSALRLSSRMSSYRGASACGSSTIGAEASATSSVEGQTPRLSASPVL